MTADTEREVYEDGQVVERGPDGRFKGGSLPHEEAVTRGRGGGRKPKDILERAQKLLAQHPSMAGMSWDDAPEAARLLAEMAARQETGGLAALQSFLNSPELAGLAKQRQAAVAVAWSGGGPCPTCKRQPEPTLILKPKVAVYLARLMAEADTSKADELQAMYDRGEKVVWDVRGIGAMMARELLDEIRRLEAEDQIRAGA